MERVLTFKYPFECIEEIEKLKNVFTENKIDFILYQSNGYYPHEFIVRKSNKKWNDIIEMINSIKSSVYKFKKTNIELRDGKLQEVDFI